MRINDIELSKMPSKNGPAILKSKRLMLTMSMQEAYLANWYETVRQEEKHKLFRKKIDDEQIDLHIKWINLQYSSVLFRRNDDDDGTTSIDDLKRFYSWLKVKDLSEDLADGLRLIYLIEIIYDTSLIKEFGDRTFGCLKLHKIKNHDTCLNYLKKQVKIKCEGINPVDLAEGNTKIIIGLLFLIRHNHESKKYKELKSNQQQQQHQLEQQQQPYNKCKTINLKDWNKNKQRSKSQNRVILDNKLSSHQQNDIQDSITTTIITSPSTNTINNNNNITRSKLSSKNSSSSTHNLFDYNPNSYSHLLVDDGLLPQQKQQQQHQPPLPLHQQSNENDKQTLLLSSTSNYYIDSITSQQQQQNNYSNDDKDRTRSKIINRLDEFDNTYLKKLSASSSSSPSTSNFNNYKNFNDETLRDINSKNSIELKTNEWDEVFDSENQLNNKSILIINSNNNIIKNNTTNEINHKSNDNDYYNNDNNKSKQLNYAHVNIIKHEELILNEQIEDHQNDENRYDDNQQTDDHYMNEFIKNSTRNNIHYNDGNDGDELNYPETNLIEHEYAVEDISIINSNSNSNYDDDDSSEQLNNHLQSYNNLINEENKQQQQHQLQQNDVYEMSQFINDDESIEEDFNIVDLESTTSLINETNTNNKNELELISGNSNIDSSSSSKNRNNENANNFEFYLEKTKFKLENESSNDELLDNNDNDSNDINISSSSSSSSRSSGSDIIKEFDSIKIINENNQIETDLGKNFDINSNLNENETEAYFETIKVNKLKSTNDELNENDYSTNEIIENLNDLNNRDGDEHDDHDNNNEELKQNENNTPNEIVQIDMCRLNQIEIETTKSNQIVNEMVENNKEEETESKTQYDDEFAQTLIPLTQMINPNRQENNIINEYLISNDDVTNNKANINLNESFLLGVDCGVQIVDINNIIPEQLKNLNRSEEIANLSVNNSELNGTSNENNELVVCTDESINEILPENDEQEEPTLPLINNEQYNINDTIQLNADLSNNNNQISYLPIGNLLEVLKNDNVNEDDKKIESTPTTTTKTNFENIKFQISQHKNDEIDEIISTPHLNNQRVVDIDAVFTKEIDQIQLVHSLNNENEQDIDEDECSTIPIVLRKEISQFEFKPKSEENLNNNQQQHDINFSETLLTSIKKNNSERLRSDTTSTSSSSSSSSSCSNRNSTRNSSGCDDLSEQLSLRNDNGLEEDQLTDITSESYEVSSVCSSKPDTNNQLQQIPSEYEINNNDLCDNRNLPSYAYMVAHGTPLTLQENNNSTSKLVKKLNEPISLDLETISQAPVVKKKASNRTNKQTSKFKSNAKMTTTANNNNNSNSKIVTSSDSIIEPIKQIDNFSSINDLNKSSQQISNDTINYSDKKNTPPAQPQPTTTIATTTSVKSKNTDKSEKNDTNQHADKSKSSSVVSTNSIMQENKHLSNETNSKKQLLNNNTNNNNSQPQLVNRNKSSAINNNSLNDSKNNSNNNNNNNKKKTPTSSQQIETSNTKNASHSLSSSSLPSSSSSSSSLISKPSLSNIVIKSKNRRYLKLALIISFLASTFVLVILILKSNEIKFNLNTNS